MSEQEYETRCAAGHRHYIRLRLGGYKQGEVRCRTEGCDAVTMHWSLDPPAASSGTQKP